MPKIEKYSKSAAARMMGEVWNVLDADEQRLVEMTLTVERFKKYEMIYRVGARPEYLYFLLSGRVKIYRDGLGGKRLINRVLRPGQFFGYRAAIAYENYVTEAAAFEESSVLLLPVGIVLNMMRTNAALCRFFVKALAVDLGAADKRIVSLTQKHVRGRLAETLLDLQDIYGMENDGETLDLRISREDLASLSNMTTSNAIRTLSMFADNGLLEVKGRKIRFLNVGELRRISEGNVEKAIPRG